MTNYKYVDAALNSQYSVAGASPTEIVSQYRHSLAGDSSYGFRWHAVQYQIGHAKSCSDWVSYFSNYSEIWSFFLFFYCLALLFFFFYIIPESLASTRLALSFATPKSWISGAIACGVPFVLIFGILYESIFLLFTNETHKGRILPSFLIEGRQWKWEYRYNLACLFEHMAAYKLVGHSAAVAGSPLGVLGTREFSYKVASLVGSELTESSLRVKSELLKSVRQTASTTNLLAVSATGFGEDSIRKPHLAAATGEFFSKFRISETARRMLTTTRSVILPDTSVVRAQITSADVIHSWAIPGLGVRIDAVPGKLYSVKIPFKYYGTFNGQCSEVCGLRHAYMPISISFTTYAFFVKSVYVLLFSGADLFFFKFYTRDTPV